MTEQQFLMLSLENQAVFLDMFGNIGMLWWVSAVVFCATIVGTAWWYSDDRNLFNRPHSRWLILAIYIFFLSVVAYGIWSAVTAKAVWNEYLQMTARLSMAPVQNAEYRFIFWGYILGTTSFGLLLFIWGLISTDIWRNRS